MARDYTQAQKFGVEIAIPDEAIDLEPVKGAFSLALLNGERVSARSVVIASGARYRRLAVADVDRFEGSSIHYWATPLEGKLGAGQAVALVGGGNSAGQAAVFLTRHAAKVTVLVRGPAIEAGMSSYLVERLSGLPNVDVLTNAEVIALEGASDALQAVRWRHGRTGTETTLAARHLFLFIGAAPNTDWLARCGLALDDKGFLRTGPELGDGRHPLETSIPGVFAIGDVRSGSVKRVAAAVEEGAQVVAALHEQFAAKAASQPQVI